MRRSDLILAVTAFLAFFLPINASAGDFPFQGGEKCSYKLNYKLGVISADIAKLEMNITEETYKGTPCFRLLTKGATSNLVGNLVKVNYFYDSRFSSDDLTPLNFFREQTEGDYWAKNSYTWTSGGKRLSAHVDKSTRGVRDTVFTASSPIYDVIEALYVIRAHDLASLKEKGGQMHCLAALDCNVYDIYVSYVKSENKKAPEMGTFATDKYCMQMYRRDGGEVLSKESAIAVSGSPDGRVAPVYLWTSTGEDKTILFFSAPVAVGSINGRITSVSGGRYPVEPIK